MSPEASMGGASPPPAVASRRGGRCCLWGCGACLLLLALLGIGGWLLYVRYGAPWVEAQKVQLVERFPALTTLVRLKEMAGMFGGMTLSGGELGDPDPAVFPSDIWLPPDAREALFNTTAGGAYAAFTLDDAAARPLAARIRSEMARHGWECTPIRDHEGAVTLLFTKHRREARFEIFNSERGLEVWLQVLRSIPQQS